MQVVAQIFIMLSQHHPLVLCILSAAAFSCADELVQEVESDVCYSGLQWVGGKRGSPEMYPGRDCVGCHLDNDGPELMFGGTVYPYVESDLARAGLEPPTGTDCFGVEGQRLVITGGDGQVFEVKTNRAGNFFAEGRASDLVKPFAAALSGRGETEMSRHRP